MRVLQLIDYLAPLGGMKRFAYELSDNLIRHGDETLIAAYDDDEGDGWGDCPVPAAVLGDHESDWLKLAKSFRPDAILWHCGPKTSKAAEKLAEHYTLVSVIHIPLCPSGTKLFRDRDEICSKPTGAACMVNWYTRRCGTRPEPWTMLQGMLSSQRMLRVVRRSHHVYAVSISLKQMLVNDGISPDRIRVFDNTLGGVLEPMPPLSPASGNAETHLLYAGRLVYSKGVQYLLQTVRELTNRGIPVKATIVGDGWYRNELEKLAAQLDVSEKVHFMGEVPGREIGSWYERADLVIVPSIWPEPAGLVVPEARKMGKPVIVYDAGGLKEWVSYMDGIYVVPNKDVGKLADKIAEWSLSALSPLASAYADSRAAGVSRSKSGTWGADGLDVAGRASLIRDLHGIFHPNMRKEEWG